VGERFKRCNGVACRLGRERDRRFSFCCSFCCAVDGCRSRATPPSLRFLGQPSSANFSEAAKIAIICLTFS
jgi:hypothetical protein